MRSEVHKPNQGSKIHGETGYRRSYLCPTWAAASSLILSAAKTFVAELVPLTELKLKLNRLRKRPHSLLAIPPFRHTLLFSFFISGIFILFFYVLFLSVLFLSVTCSLASGQH